MVSKTDRGSAITEGMECLDFIINPVTWKALEGLDTEQYDLYSVCERSF